MHSCSIAKQEYRIRPECRGGGLGASCEHAYDLTQAHGESRLDGPHGPAHGGGLIYANSIVALDSARTKTLVPRSRGGSSA